MVEDQDHLINRWWRWRWCRGIQNCNRIFDVNPGPNTVTVGAGGGGRFVNNPPVGDVQFPGSESVFSSITSKGGGGGGTKDNNGGSSSDPGGGSGGGGFTPVVIKAGGGLVVEHMVILDLRIANSSPFGGAGGGGAGGGAPQETQDLVGQVFKFHQHSEILVQK